MAVAIFLIFTMHIPCEHRVRLTDISLSQAAFAAKMSAGIEIPIKVIGRVKAVQIDVHPHYIVAYANGFNIYGDPIRWLRLIVNRQTRWYNARMEALGGYIEADGVLPK